MCVNRQAQCQAHGRNSHNRFKGQPPHLDSQTDSPRTAYDVSHWQVQFLSGCPVLCSKRPPRQASHTIWQTLSPSLRDAGDSISISNLTWQPSEQARKMKWNIKHKLIRRPLSTWNINCISTLLKKLLGSLYSLKSLLVSQNDKRRQLWGNHHIKIFNTAENKLLDKLKHSSLADR